MTDHADPQGMPLSTMEEWPDHETNDTGRGHEHGLLEPEFDEEPQADQGNHGRRNVEDRPLSQDHDGPGDGAAGGRRGPGGERLQLRVRPVALEPRGRNDGEN